MDPFPQQQPPAGSGGPKVALVVVAVVVVLGLLGLGVFLVTTGGDDSDDDDTVEAASEDTVDEDEDEADLDQDGIPDAEDDDIDGDDVPDEEDEAPLDPDIPDPGGGDDGDGEDAGEEGPDGTTPPEETNPPEETTPPTEETDPPSQPGGLFEDPSVAIDAWLDAAGQGSHAIEVVLYPEYGFATLRDPDHPNRLQRWGWRDGAVDGPEDEEPFPGTDLEAEQFRLDRPNWDALPRLIANAPERAGLPRGEVTHVITTSDLPFSDRKIFRIYVVAPDGRSGSVVATIDGDPVAN